MCDPVQFAPVTAEKWARIQLAANAQGINITAPAGETDAQGNRIRWNWNPATATLEVQCLNRSRILQDIVNARIRELFAEATR